jgi:hypothetical protein
MEAIRGNASEHPQAVSFDELPMLLVVRPEAHAGLVGE